MLVFIIILMLIVTIYAVNMIAENGRKVKVGEVTTTRHLTNVGCICVAFTAVAYDVISLYLIMRVV